ncbi:MAG: FkbM family methyltransferase [Pirellulaceae bacterium]|nr:FkbM family methyltransferase [Pirellulaceae bacterium]
MAIRGFIKRLAERLTGTFILKSLPRGLSVLHDVKVTLPKFSIEVIFDIGANVGQSALEYTRALPTARIYSFEPIRRTFELLEANTKNYPRITCAPLAFGAGTGTAMMLSDGVSTINHLIASEDSCQMVDGPTEEVAIDTLDNFCAKRGIARISYLKVDTEGADIDVLKGAGQMLAEQRIDLIELEAGMNPGNKYHVPFAALKDFLELRDYYLFGIYEQVGEWPTKESHLRRTNPVFISKSMVAAHRAAA